jgi:hypothetical protein
MVDNSDEFLLKNFIYGEIDGDDSLHLLLHVLLAFPMG